ncbi:Rpp20 subunit of nuclear RNase MRP and P-domain-containing protein [Xylariaceae sp. FL0662B]|nr:Rpp20 subunit of nuclear RNase MRP and P-domain-containing protein [Xylariaceae sp. FL0662B]
MTIMSDDDSPEAHSQLPEGSKISKLPAIPEGSTIRKRPMPTRLASTHSSHRIYINAKTPFRSVTTRVRKKLDKYLREASASNKTFTNKLASKKNASLDARIQAIQRQSEKGRAGGIGLEDAGEVVVLGTGRAIQKVTEVALFFQKQRDCVVQLRTGSVGAVDDVIAEDDEEWGGGGEQRVRMVSCLEASIRLR